MTFEYKGHKVLVSYSGYLEVYYVEIDHRPLGSFLEIFRFDSAAEAESQAKQVIDAEEAAPLDKIV